MFVTINRRATAGIAVQILSRNHGRVFWSAVYDNYWIDESHACGLADTWAGIRRMVLKGKPKLAEVH